MRQADRHQRQQQYLGRNAAKKHFRIAAEKDEVLRLQRQRHGEHNDRQAKGQPDAGFLIDGDANGVKRNRVHIQSPRQSRSRIIQLFCCVATRLERLAAAHHFLYTKLKAQEI